MQRLRDDTGTTLAELLVVCVLMTVVLSTAYMIFNATSTMANESEARAVAADNAQHAIETMTREIRQASENEEGYGAMVVAQPQTVEFFMDANRDNRPEKIKYYLSGDSIMRAVAPAIGTQPPYSYGSYGTGEAILTGLVSTTAPIFCFHGTTPDTAVVCANGEQHGFQAISTGSPLTTSPKISMVGVTLDNTSMTGRQSAQVHTIALIRIRSVENVVK